MTKIKKQDNFRASGYGTGAAALVIALLLLGYSQNTAALTVDIGSKGGTPIHITTDTVFPLPDDGIIHTDSFILDEGVTLSFSHSLWMHPGVVILSTGDVVINGTIDIRGKDGVDTAGGTGGPGGGAGANGRNSSSDPIPHVPMMGTERAGGIRFPGGAGGRSGQSPSGSSCTQAGGGGGGGSLYIGSHTRIIAGSDAKIMAAGGAPGSNSCLPMAGDSSKTGEAGAVRLTAPTVDAGSLIVEAQYLRVGGLVTPGLPQYIDSSANGVGSYYIDNDLPRWPASMPTIVITHIDGVAVTPGAIQTLTGIKTNVEITAHVDGCTGEMLTVRIRAIKDYSGGAHAAFVANPTGSDDSVVTIPVGDSAGESTLVYAWFECKG